MDQGEVSTATYSELLDDVSVPVHGLGCLDQSPLKPKYIVTKMLGTTKTQARAVINQ